jgi:hypothetical protein
VDGLVPTHDGPIDTGLHILSCSLALGVLRQEPPSYRDVTSATNPYRSIGNFDGFVFPVAMLSMLWWIVLDSLEPPWKRAIVNSILTRNVGGAVAHHLPAVRIQRPLHSNATVGPSVECLIG